MNKSPLLSKYQEKHFGYPYPYPVEMAQSKIFQDRTAHSLQYPVH